VTKLPGSAHASPPAPPAPSRLLERLRASLASRPPMTIDAARSRAAVAAVLRAQGEQTQVLLIRRAEHPGDPWSGHMAFPGGRFDEGDADLVHTVTRETLEELQLDLQAQAQLIGRLDDIPAYARGVATGLVVAPFVFWLPGTEGPVLQPNHEVAEALWAELGPMIGGHSLTTLDYPHDGMVLKMPGFQVGERVVWGLTYLMLQSLLSRLH
jgi:8-oxo-dGTP pyrophosphatase MutT (NUDIX family)